jgi:DNA-binding GntR family transcriptional regulator
LRQPVGRPVADAAAQDFGDRLGNAPGCRLDYRPILKAAVLSNAESPPARVALFATSVPFHHQIAQVLRGRIDSGSWGHGVTEQALCEEFGVSRTTVRHALGSLKHEGLLHSRRGVGTHGVPRAGPTRLVRGSGDPLHGAIATKPRVVSSGKGGAPPEVAAFFGLAPGAPVLRVVRLHDLDGAPLSVVVSYLPAEIAARLTRAALRGPTHEMLWQRFALKQKRSMHALRVARADPMVASLLGIGLAEPVLRVQSSVYLDDDRPIRWTENFFREDRYEYHAEMEWPDPATTTRPADVPSSLGTRIKVRQGGTVPGARRSAVSTPESSATSARRPAARLEKSVPMKARSKHT